MSDPIEVNIDSPENPKEGAELNIEDPSGGDIAGAEISVEDPSGGDISGTEINIENPKV